MPNKNYKSLFKKPQDEVTYTIYENFTKFCIKFKIFVKILPKISAMTIS